MLNCGHFAIAGSAGVALPITVLPACSAGHGDAGDGGYAAAVQHVWQPFGMAVSEPNTAFLPLQSELARYSGRWLYGEKQGSHS